MDADILHQGHNSYLTHAVRPGRRDTEAFAPARDVRAGARGQMFLTAVVANTRRPTPFT